MTYDAYVSTDHYGALPRPKLTVPTSPPEPKGPVEPLCTSNALMQNTVFRKHSSVKAADVLHAIRSRVTRLVRLGDDDYEADDGEVTQVWQANVVTSAVSFNPEAPFAEVMHRPTIDIDVPAYVLPSSTLGHSHLYIEHEMTWDQYTELLDVMVKVGLVEEGYMKVSLRRKRTDLRLPWVPKHSDTSTVPKEI